MAGNDHVVEVEYSERGVTRLVDERPFGRQLQLLLRRVDAVLAYRYVAPACMFRGRRRPGERIPGCRESRQVLREGCAQRSASRSRSDLSRRQRA
ncbi:hypothetical protein [Streptomyces phytophilus]|uniref:hypothetical protein n=1 Tax=Streptomyces phytophilus TaxID=722715 RepID=UPI0015F1194B|nr:hypothetical protein [Streptomyces phytophilus]